MIKGINQSMINRAIAGGIIGKCTNHGGGGGSNTQKITLNFTICTEPEGDKTQYALKSEIDSMIDEVFDIDLTRYRYTSGVLDRTADIYDYWIETFPLSIYAYTANTDEGEATTFSLADIPTAAFGPSGDAKSRFVISYAVGGSEIHHVLEFGGSEVSAVESIPSGATTKQPITLTLYYEPM